MIINSAQLAGLGFPASNEARQPLPERRMYSQKRATPSLGGLGAHGGPAIEAAQTRAMVQEIMQLRKQVAQLQKHITEMHAAHGQAPAAAQVVDVTPPEKRASMSAADNAWFGDDDSSGFGDLDADLGLND